MTKTDHYHPFSFVDKFIQCSILVFVLFFASYSFTFIPEKNNKDCIDAFQICSLGNYYFPTLNGFGSEEYLGLTNTNLEETNSLWLQFTASTSGELEFVIVPDNSEDDIDFVLYQGSTCEKKDAVRIMTSGKAVGLNADHKCVGQTGLQKISLDSKESDGCFDLDDNFLKPRYLDSGETYFLLINNFNSSDGVTVLFAGDAGLELENKCQNESNQEISLDLFPNPVANELNVKLSQSIDMPAHIQLFDQSGKLFYNKDTELLSGQFSINVSDFPSGKYFLKMSNEHMVELKSFIKI